MRMRSEQVLRTRIFRVLNHKEGVVTSICERHGYFKEKLATLKVWGCHLD